MNGTAYLIIISAIIVAIVSIIIVILLTTKKRKNYYASELEKLERNKNLIISASIMSELNKVESLINNDQLKDKYEDWKFRFREIKDKEVPEITEELNELEDFFIFKSDQEILHKIANIELKIYYVKMRSKFLLEEIKDITLSEEKNREIVTRLKTEYRKTIQKYKSNYNDYKEVTAPIELQLENIDKLFTAFEVAMEQNYYSEVNKIVKAMNETINNLKVVVDEAPSIIVMGKSIIPRKIDDISKIDAKMRKDGFVLDFLNLPYNIDEVNKKLQDIFSRLNVLNLEDSIFELKTIIDYFDSIYNDFEKERIAKKMFDEYQRTLVLKASRLTKIGKSLYSKIDDIKYNYDIKNNDTQIINEINNDLSLISKDIENAINAHRAKAFAYSRLTKEMEHLNVKLSKIEERLEVAVRTLGSLKEDELRAREQLDEITQLLKEAVTVMKSYKLPVIPKKYYTELSEVNDAINEVVKELEKKPISIETLNIRVDTARDLVLKLYNTSKETIKTAKMAEIAIIYGNRYRITKEIALGLTKAELSFYKGSYRNSLENAINAINIIEPGIYNKLLDESIKS